MKVSSVKTEQRVERNVWNTYLGIKAYGSNNDYPQKILEVVSASGTGKSCVDIYNKFVIGEGFKDQALAKTVINSNEEKANSLLAKCAKDLRNFNGFAILVKYSGLALPAEFYNVPFEQCRIGINNSLEYTGQVAIHSDWTGITGKRFANDDIEWVNVFNVKKAFEQIKEKGSPKNFVGQLFYFTSDGEFEYPVSPFDPIVTDMLTEESVSTVKHRNAKYNFLPAGILVRKGLQLHTKDDGTVDANDPYNQEQIASAKMIERMQGDNNAVKIWVVDVDADEEKPEFIPFSTQNYDKQYELTEKTVQENIGKMFMIPPILRGVDVGAGFGADLMNNAYDFMNSVTHGDRIAIQQAFEELFKYFPKKFSNFEIAPLTYITPVEKTSEKKVIKETEEEVEEPEETEEE